MRRHPIDALSLAFGLVFVGLAGALLTPGLGLAALTSPWLWPTLLIVLGAVLLVSSLPRPQRSTDPGPSQRDGDEAPPDADGPNRP
ncbi:MAG: hypothetical protein R6T85_08530 [Egibacteraceae bacterium]